MCVFRRTNAEPVRRRLLGFCLPSVLVLCGAACFPRVGPAVDGGDFFQPGDGVSVVAEGCADGLKDGDESDVDCGGSCTACDLRQACGTALDCASGRCSAGQCVTQNNTCGVFAGCTTFVDLRDAGSSTIHFPVGGERYSPSCVRVRFGQTVTFSGSFSSHGLAQGCGPVTGVISASSGQSASVVFDQALGVFGFYCTQHGSRSGGGMAGAIEVVR